MAYMALRPYLGQIYEALRIGDGNVVAEYLSCRHPHVASPKLNVEDPEPDVIKIVDPPWDEVVTAHLKCIYCINNHDFIEAYKHQYFLVQTFTKIFSSQKEENWALPIMYTCCLDLRNLAISADFQLAKKGMSKTEDMLEKAAELLMGCFRVCVGDTRSVQEESKRWGTLFLTNQLFKIYFKVNKVHLVKPLLRAIESSNLKDQFPISQRVTYKFYVGQKAMFESDFRTAEEHLSFAFVHCHKHCKKNKRLILIYLTPVKMLLGKIPTLAVLKKYDLMQFYEVAQGLIQGNLDRLNQALKTNENFFIKCGIFLILERLKIIVYRNLFKKVYLMHNNHVIAIDAFVDALQAVKAKDMDKEEVLCILSNLIFEGKIKGYISYQHQKLVLSKQNAFPSLSATS